MLTRGQVAQASQSNGTDYFRPDKVAVNTMFVLAPALENVLGVTKFGVFTASKGPFNASWADIGKDDVGYSLGLRPSPKNFLWVAVMENGEYVAKLWECSGQQFEVIATQVREYDIPLQGMMIKLQKNSKNRWEMSANRAPKSKEVKEATLNALWGEIVEKGLDGSEVDTEAVYKMVGLYPTVALEKEMLIKRAQVANWTQVLQKFGIAPKPEDTDEDLEELE